MADSVYYHLERMLPELEDLKERGLFSEAEVKEIARRRREFEFKLQRRSKVKDDYLNYIEYELKLDKLRVLRKKALVRELQSSKRKWQSSLCDRASAMHIMLIYERASTRFKGDLDLWMQYLEYCKSQGTRRMQKVLTKVLCLHPMVSIFWIYASAWEFEHNANITAARALMKQGLRMCSESEQLWLECFQLELVYLERLKANTFSLATAKEVSEKNNEGNDLENPDLILGLVDDDKDKLEEGNMVVSRNKAGIDSSTLDELAYKVAWKIYKNAVTALPSNLELRRKFIGLLQKANFSQATFLQDEIFSSIESDFPLDSGCWDWQARFRFQASGDTEIAAQIYERGLVILPSAEMYELYAKFWKEALGLDGPKRKSLFVLPNERVLVARRLLNLYDKAKGAGVLSSCLAEGHANLLLQLGKLDEAKHLLKELCVGPLKNCSMLWLLKISIEMKTESSADVSSQKLADLFEQSLKHVPSAEAGELWALMMQFCGCQVAMQKCMVNIMLHKLASTAGDDNEALLACSLVDWIFCCQDISRTRSLYNRILALPCSSVLFYKHCIDMECWMATMGCKDAPNFVRRLYERALSRDSQNVDLWLEYCSLETKAGNMDAAGNIYWRAKSLIDDPSGFIEGHQRLMAKEGT